MKKEKEYKKNKQTNKQTAVAFLRRRETAFKAFEHGIFSLLTDKYSEQSEQPEQSEKSEQSEQFKYFTRIK